MPSDEQSRGPDWRWIAGGGLALIGPLVAFVFYLHTSMEDLRNNGQDVRIAAVEADVRGIRDMGAKVAVMDAKMNVLTGGLDRLESALGKISDRLEARVVPAPAQPGKK